MRILVILALFLAGCGDDSLRPIKVKPQIQSNLYEAKVGHVFEVVYVNHDQRGWCRVRLSTKEDVASYKKQVQRLLESIEDAEKRVEK